MTNDAQPSPALLEVVHRAPLVVLAVVESAAAVPVLTAELASAFPDAVFVGIMTAEDDDTVLRAIVDGLTPPLAEMLFTASSSPGAIPGDTLAWRALDELGVGQDFVFTVPLLHDAVRYALARLTGDQDEWDATALLVPGPVSTIEEARRLFPPPLADRPVDP